MSTEHLVQADADQVSMLRLVNRPPKMDSANESERLILQKVGLLLSEISRELPLAPCRENMKQQSTLLRSMRIECI